MSVIVTNLTNAVQTLDAVDLPPWGKQLRARHTTALDAAAAAKSVQLNDVDSATVTIQEEVPVAAATVQAGDSCEVLAMDPAGTLATLTVNMPLAPYDGQPLELSSTAAVTALTMTASGSGQTLKGGLTALAANGFGRWRYSLANKTWYRVG